MSLHGSTFCLIGNTPLIHFGTKREVSGVHNIRTSKGIVNESEQNRMERTVATATEPSDQEENTTTVCTDYAILRNGKTFCVRRSVTSSLESLQLNPKITQPRFLLLLLLPYWPDHNSARLPRLLKGLP